LPLTYAVIAVWRHGDYIALQLALRCYYGYHIAITCAVTILPRRHFQRHYCHFAAYYHYCHMAKVVSLFEAYSH